MTEATNDSQACEMPVPGKPHELIDPFAGVFDSEVRLWMGPGDPMVSTGTMTSTWQIGGLYLHQDYVGDPNEGPFPSFKGQGYWGFNQHNQKYEGFWIDNASGMMQLEDGDVDPSGMVWTMVSEISRADGQVSKKRSVITLVDSDHNKMEMFMGPSDADESKVMEILYTRKS